MADSSTNTNPPFNLPPGIVQTSNVPPPKGVSIGPAIHATNTHLFFYGYELQLPESRLQNWYPASFVDDTNDRKVIRFQTMEHYIMYRKALAMSDEESAKLILDASTPGEANALGRKVKNYRSEVWRPMVEKVAEEGTYFKFSQVKECREALLATGDKTLVESNPGDGIWGIGFRGDEAEGRTEEEWGRNIAGKALMRVRERLRKEESGKTL